MLVAMIAVIFFKIISHDHTYFRIVIVQAFAGFVVKITAAGKLQSVKQLSNGILSLKGIYYQGFLPVLQGQNPDTHVFFSSFAFVRISRSSCN